MNYGRLSLAIIGGFIFLCATAFLVHGVWLSGDYKAAAELWRSQEEIRRRFIILGIAQFLAALSFLYIWARTGWRRRSVLDGCSFGFWMGLFQQIMTLAFYVVLPMRKELAFKWFLAGMLQAILLGGLSTFIYRPRPILGDRRP
jgi:hypothetical protein